MLLPLTCLTIAELAERHGFTLPRNPLHSLRVLSLVARCLVILSLILAAVAVVHFSRLLN